MISNFFFFDEYICVNLEVPIPGLPDFLLQHSKKGNNYQIAIKYTKWSQNIPTRRNIDEMAINYTNIFLPLQAPSKFTQIWIFGLKICHLATLS
jgi:hypothetical protein